MANEFKNVFVASDGDLINKDTFKVVRERYIHTYTRITNSHELRATIRNGGTMWPGGYPLYLIFADGEPCCFECAKKDYKCIAYDMKSEANRAQWAIVGCDINYEDEYLYCEHCNKQIESAYGNDESSDSE